MYTYVVYLGCIWSIYTVHVCGLFRMNVVYFEIIGSS